MLVRPATHDDAAFLLALRNDPEVRAASRSTAPVTSDGHEAWLGQVLADPDRHLLVVERGGEAVGQVRFDAQPHGWEISVSLIPAARGGGAGAAAIEAGIAWLRERDEHGAVVAEVRDDNVASALAFRRAGFEDTGSEADGFMRLVRR